MERKDRSLLEIIARDLKKGYWKAADAARYAPMLFPLVKPDEMVRDAASAMHCSDDKEQKLKLLRSFVNKEKEGRDFLKDFESILSGNKDRLLTNQETTDQSRNYRDIIMLLLATNFASQKSTVSITTDVTQLFKHIFSECEDCAIKKSCKGAFGILTEYITSALHELDANLIHTN